MGLTPPPGKYMSPEVFGAIHRHLPDYLKDFFEVAYWLGIRKGQLEATLLSNVDADRWALVYEPGQVKNRQPHAIPLEERPREIVQRLWTNRRLDCPYLFHRDGERLGNFKKAWAAACRKAGFPVGRKNGGYVFHNTRHTAVTNMVHGGMPEALAMTVSGHRTRSVFDHYSIRREDATREAFKKVTKYVTSLSAQGGAKVIPLSPGAKTRRKAGESSRRK
jgi:integrase